MAKSCCINLNCAICYQASVGEDRNSIILAHTRERSTLNAHLDFEHWVSVLSWWRLIASSVQYNRLFSTRSFQMNPIWCFWSSMFCMYRSQSEVWDWLKSGNISSFITFYKVKLLYRFSHTWQGAWNPQTRSNQCNYITVPLSDPNPGLCILIIWTPAVMNIKRSGDTSIVFGPALHKSRRLHKHQSFRNHHLFQRFMLLWKRFIFLLNSSVDVLSSVMRLGH